MAEIIQEEKVKMKKFFALILALCMVFALCACGESAPKQDTPAVEESSAPAVEESTAPEATGWAPNGPVTMIVSYKAGSGTDNTARILAKYAEKYLGQTIVIENVDGGSGSIGWSQLAAADPDGMTIGFMNLPNFNSSIVKELGTYTTADFAAICNHVTETSLVICRADETRFDDIEGLVEYAKANPTVASTNGPQASNHIGAQAFAKSADFMYTDVPQGNTADEILSLLGGEADWCVVKAADIVGRTDVKVLAVFSAERLPEYPDVPTLGEKGFYDKWLGSSRCIVAPAGVSEEVIKFYENAFKQAMEDPDYLAAASEFATDFKDAATTAALIEEQQQFTESLASGFWYE